MTKYVRENARLVFLLALMEYSWLHYSSLGSFSDGQLWRPTFTGEPYETETT